MRPRLRLAAVSLAAAPLLTAVLAAVPLRAQEAELQATPAPPLEEPVEAPQAAPWLEAPPELPEADASAEPESAVPASADSEIAEAERPAEAVPAISPQPPRARPLEGIVRAVTDWAREHELEAGVRDLGRRQLTPGARKVLALGLGAFALLTLLSLGLRRRTAVHVFVDYPAQLRGTFRVRLRRRPVSASREPRITSPADAQLVRRRSGGSSARTHLDVSRETLFLGVPCRRVYLCVDGFAQSEDGTDVVAIHFAEQEVRPRPGEPLRLCFDFQPHACAVDLRVVWNQSPVDGAQVVRRGSPSSLRYARGTVRIPLDRGVHTLLAGSNDRVGEVRIEIDSFEPRRAVIDLEDRGQLVFSGCPRAVEPYLLGDVPTAARCLEREGQVEVAARLLARFHADDGRMEQAAREFERAGDWSSAAEIRESLEEPRRAAELYEREGEDERAAHCYRSAGEARLAGEAFLRAGAWESAADSFREAGEVSRWLEALTKAGRHFSAAKVALERGERAQAIQCLRRVAVDEEDYPEAAVLLAESYEREGHTDLARTTLEELVAARPEPEVPCEAMDRLSRLCETTGELERAITLLEGLRRREPTWPQVATRVEALRRRRTSPTTHRQDGAPTHAIGSDAFSEAFRYEILEEIGRGGMGVVFRARDRRLGREVALKRLPDHIRNNPKAVELFLREARAAASLNHPNIVTVHDAGQEGDSFYMTMELLRGQPLQQLLKSRERLEPGFVVKLAGQAARGLQYAHEQGIVHRDVKTANLFFTEKKVVKIMDFGLAKMVEEVRRSTTVIGGTPYYMAPEQSAGEQVDHRSDLYALGVTLFELLTGRVPFRDGDIAFHHRHSPPPSLGELAPDVPEALASLVTDLLAKRPAERVRSAREVVVRLAEIARGASAGPVGP